MVDKKSVSKKVVKKPSKKKSMKRTVNTKTSKKSNKIGVEKIKSEPIITVKHESVSKDKIISGVSKAVSDVIGLNVNIVRVLFGISFVFLIGIPIYLLLSIFMKD